MYEPSWFLHVVIISIYKDEDLKKKKKICDYLNYLILENCFAVLEPLFSFMFL